MIDSRIYKLEFPDGRVEEYSDNVIIKNILDQVKSNDWDTSLFDEVISARKDYNAIDKGPGAYVIVNGFKKPVIITKVWGVQVKWKNRSISWLPLPLVKLSSPIDLT